MNEQLISLCREIWENNYYLGGCTVKSDKDNKTRFIKMKCCEIRINNGISFFIYPDHLSIYIQIKEDLQSTYSIYFKEKPIELPHITKYELQAVLLYLLEQLDSRIFIE